MALVIFCVALVAAMRTRMSLRLAMGSIYPLAEVRSLARGAWELGGVLLARSDVLHHHANVLA